MSYRGTVKNGIVVLEGGIKLPDGQPVEVTTLPVNSTIANDLPAFGLWQDRTDITDSADESLRLRKSIERRAD